MRAAATCILGLLRAACLLAAVAFPACLRAEPGPQRSTPLVQHTTPSGVGFGVSGPKPEQPRPTLFIFATSLQNMAAQPIYSEAGRHLEQHGWLWVTVEPPCHGHDARPGEPAELAGWAARLQSGEDLFGPFVERVKHVLDYLIEQGYTDPLQVAAMGTSRGGLCAMQVAAQDARIRRVAAVSPVTELGVLAEFAALTPAQLQPASARALVDQLAGRPVWISIGNQDGRVGTAECVAFSQALVTATRAQQPALQQVPVTLIMGPSQGHQSIAGAYSLAAEFILAQTEPAAPADCPPRVRPPGAR